MPAHDHRLRQFVRELLRAFASTDSYACERLGARSGQLGNNRGWSSFNVAGGSITSSSIVSRRSRGGFEACAMMRRVHALCVVESISALCTLLCVPEDVPDRVAVALGNINPSTSSEIDGSRELDLQELLKCMEGIECNFLGVSRSLTRSKSNRAWVSEYQPDWRTRNLIWDLIKSLGKIQPPQECAGAFRRFKEAAFAALFKGDYLLEQRNRAGFKNTLLRHFPRPDAWDASMGWLAVCISNARLAIKSRSFGFIGLATGLTCVATSKREKVSTIAMTKTKQKAEKHCMTHISFLTAPFSSSSSLYFVTLPYRRPSSLLWLTTDLIFTVACLS